MITKYIKGQKKLRNDWKNIWNFQKELDFWVDTFFNGVLWFLEELEKQTHNLLIFSCICKNWREKKLFHKSVTVFDISMIFGWVLKTQNQKQIQETIWLWKQLSCLLLHSKCEDKVIVHWPIYIPKISQIFCGSGFCILVFYIYFVFCIPQWKYVREIL